MPNRLIIDCDPGLDDAIMLLTLASQHRQGATEILAVTTAAGNVRADHTVRNARYLLDLAGLNDIPVYGGARRPLSRIRVTDAMAFHGADGIGGCFPIGHSMEVAEENAIDELRRLLNGSNGDVTILATGALTNLALTLSFSKNDRLTERPLVVMGGAFGTPAGNVTATAEFNFWFDPESARRIFESEQAIRLVPLDVTERTTLGESDVTKLRGGGRLAQYAATLVAASINNHRRELDIDECHMHDALAAATLFDCDVVRFERGEVTVLTDLQAEGHAIFERRHPKRTLHEVATDVNVEKARGWIIDSLLALDD